MTSSNSSEVVITSEEKPSQIKSYDNWAKQQILALTQWINYKIASNSTSSSTPVNLETINNPMIPTLLPQQEKQKHINKIDLYDIKSIIESSSTLHILSKIKEEISSQRLSLRNDQNIRSNITLKEDFISLLLSYNTDILDLILQVLFTDYSNEEKEEVKIKRNYKKIIFDKILNSEEILTSYLKSGVVVMSPTIEKKYLKALNEHTLEMFLTIIVVMDQLWIKKNIWKLFFIISKKFSNKINKRIVNFIL